MTVVGERHKHIGENDCKKTVTNPKTYARFLMWYTTYDYIGLGIRLKMLRARKMWLLNKLLNKFISMYG